MEIEQDLEDDALVGLSDAVTDEISHARLHPADLGSAESDQDLDLQLAETEIAEIQDIDDALMRIQNEQYGTCEECGKEISFARLEALPYTRYCGNCEQNIELEKKSRRDGHAFENRA